MVDGLIIRLLIKASTDTAMNVSAIATGMFTNRLLVSVNFDIKVFMVYNFNC